MSHTTTTVTPQATIAERIKNARIARRISRGRLAMAANIDLTRLSRLENNLIIPDYNTIRALATALRITPSELCCLPNESSNQ